MRFEREPGAFVVSLDFELAWGFGNGVVEDEVQRTRILKARGLVPQILDTFGEFDVAATWAVVGFLFAESRVDLEELSPSVRPAYDDPSLSTYVAVIGESEVDDPLHYAPSLIRAIRDSPRQEIATHTFSHYYCLEPGQSRDSFSADLEAAIAVAKGYGVELRSIVFPRNQHNLDYDDLLVSHGITGFRGNPRDRAWTFRDSRESRRWDKRARRFIDAYGAPTGAGTTHWYEILQPSGLSDVRASLALSPYRPSVRFLEEWRLKRVLEGVRCAARESRIFHVWWHPHNFASFPQQNMAFLRRILAEVSRCRSEHGLQSLTMGEVDRLVRERSVQERASIAGRR